MRSALIITAVAAVAAVVLGVARADAPSSYVGADACGECHARELAAWRAGPHAGAARSMGKKSGDRRCQTCHTTGAAPAGQPAFPGVQCEACHGAGRAYAEDDIMRDPPLSRALGLADLSTPELRAAGCARCHRAGTRLAPLDVEAAWKRIGH